jgi:hypothetical protein
VTWGATCVWKRNGKDHMVHNWTGRRGISDLRSQRGPRPSTMPIFARSKDQNM